MTQEDIIKKLTEARNILYDDVPVGMMNAWDLIRLIKKHCGTLDELINQIEDDNRKSEESTQE